MPQERFGQSLVVLPAQQVVTARLARHRPDQPPPADQSEDVEDLARGLARDPLGRPHAYPTAVEVGGCQRLMPGVASKPQSKVASSGVGWTA